MIGTLAMVASLQSGSTEVTVYNQGLGFVKDVRTVELQSGRQSIKIEDVAQMIDASSVGFKRLSGPGQLSVLEQNYQYDLVSPAAILQKSVGKKIRLTRNVGNTKETVTGILLTSPTSVVNTGQGSEYSYNGLVVKTDDGRILLSPQGEIDVEEMPEGLISKPSLLWEVESSQSQQATIELSYLTKGMKWSSDYVFTLGANNLAGLQGWATVENRCGKSFQDAQLKLIAGEVNIEADRQPQSNFRFRDGAERSIINGDSFGRLYESSLFEYHLYTLPRPATIRNNESKQLGLLEGESIPYRKILRFDSYESSPSENNIGEQQEFNASVKVEFKNDKASHLGMPMPAGKVRMYQRSADGSLQFLGEDQIKHTPKDEKLSLSVGTAFDVRGTRRKTDFQRTAKNASRTTYEIEIRNRKTTDETVTLVEHGYGGSLKSWQVSSAGVTFSKVDARSVSADIKVKAGEVKKVRYTVDAKW